MNNTHQPIELSNCHNAPVKLVGGTIGIDFSDQEEGVTMHYECSKCLKPCDIIVDALDRLVRDLTKVHPLPKSQVKRMIRQWAISQLPEKKKVYDMENIDWNKMRRQAADLGFNQALTAAKAALEAKDD